MHSVIKDRYFLPLKILLNCLMSAEVQLQLNRPTIGFSSEEVVVGLLILLIPSQQNII
jgi:hypothetical protein